MATRPKVSGVSRRASRAVAANCAAKRTSWLAKAIVPPRRERRPRSRCRWLVSRPSVVADTGDLVMGQCSLAGAVMVFRIPGIGFLQAVAQTDPGLPAKAAPPAGVDHLDRRADRKRVG